MTTRIEGSLMNHLMAHSKQPQPEVGMGATLCMWTDRHAYTITRVSKSGKMLWAKQDKVTRIDNNGMSECQTYTFEPDPTAEEVCFRLTKKGWRGPSGRLSIGHRNEYHDFSF